MSDFLEKVKFVKSYSGVAGASLVLFSNIKDFDTWTQGLLNLSKIPNVMCRQAIIPTDLLGLRAKRCFLWNDIESFHAIIQRDVKFSLNSDFIYDLEQEEYILDFTAEKV